MLKAPGKSAALKNLALLEILKKSFIGAKKPCNLSHATYLLI